MPEILPFGDNALTVKIGPPKSQNTSDRILQICARLAAEPVWTDILPGYDSVTVAFDPLTLSPHDAQKRLRDLLDVGMTAQPKLATSTKVVDIPVCYAPPHALDIVAAAKKLRMSEAELVHRHSAPIYTVIFQGFIPGFTFCSPVTGDLILPRHKSPRQAVPAGSVGIANWQTGIYALQSPGGWQILGATPLSVFDPKREEPFLLSAGKRIRFVPISAREFDAFKEKSAL